MQLPSEVSHESRRGGGRAARRQHIVDDQDALPALDGIGVDLERVGAVLELVGLLDALAGSFPGLRIGTNPAPRRFATALPRMNPRLSMPDDELDGVVPRTAPPAGRWSHRALRDF